MSALAARPSALSSPPRAGARAAAAIHWAALAALGSFAAIRWAALVAPPATRAMLGFALGTLVILAAGRAAAGTRSGVARAGLACGACVAIAVAALVAAGVPVRLLEPANWGSLASGISQGFGALPGADVPYAGADPWTRTAILLCGAALVGAGLAAGLAASGEGRRLVAAVPLLAAAAIPEIVLSTPSPAVRGAALLFLLVAYLRADRVAARRMPLAVAAVALAALAAALAAPRLDTANGWLDYRAIADSLAPASPTTFSWDHTYGPLAWPRDGREVLRVRAAEGAYWKAENLDRFDGFAWRAVRSVGAANPAEEMPPPDRRRRAWEETIRVTVRGMETSDLVAAGAALAIARAPHEVISSGSPGTWRSGSPLRPGDAWFARIYFPRPTPAMMAAAGTAYPGLFQQYRTVGLPDGSSEVVFPAFGSGRAPSVVGAVPFGTDAVRLLESSPYAGAYALARRLAHGAATPYGFARRIERYLAGPRFVYDERPPASQVPLATFLRDGRGYCQQFAGTMALLLRMGGVPARAVAGFAPGSYDRGRREWTVADLDAHSWVEVWFPGIGWTTFDPTPSSAPALGGQSGPGHGRSAHGAQVQGGDPRSDPAARRRAGAGQGSGGGPSAWLVGGGALAAACALVLGARAVRRRRAARGTTDPLLADLERALRRSGRPPDPATTLRSLERRLSASAEAAGYVAAVRERRYRGTGQEPTAAQRSALRRELGRGLGPAGRLRALWALPPRPWRRAPRAAGPAAAPGEAALGPGLD